MGRRHDQSPPFDNPVARQALAYAIDKDAMVKARLSARRTASLANNLISTRASGTTRACKPYPFDLEKAKQLFDQAGVKPGTKFTFWALAGRRDEWITMAQILQQDLQKIGLDLDIQRNDLSTWLAKFNPAAEEVPEHDRRRLLLAAGRTRSRRSATPPRTSATATGTTSSSTTCC